MPQIILFEDDGFRDLLPLVYWRSIFELRIGRKIVLDRMAQQLAAPIGGVWTRDWIARVAAQRCGAPANQPISRPTVLVNGRWLFDGRLEVPEKACVGLTADGQIAYIACDGRSPARIAPDDLMHPQRRQLLIQSMSHQPAPGRLFRYAWELISDLPGILRREWSAEDASINSPLPPGLTVDRPDQLHVGERVTIHPAAIIDAAEGPIYVSDDVSIGPYAVIGGPAYLGPGTRINPHAWLHGGNALGPVCKVGGELCGCILNGYSNKQHLGFLGHAYVASWVNIGAGATNSNLKNTYGTIRVPVNGREVDSGVQFFGAIIGDHAKIGINTAIPTGAVVGFGASAAAAGLIPRFVPSFGWLVGNQLSSGDPLKALDVATAMMARRGIDMTDEEIELFVELGRQTREHEFSA